MSLIARKNMSKNALNYQICQEKYPDVVALGFCDSDEQEQEKGQGAGGIQCYFGSDQRTGLHELPKW